MKLTRLAILLLVIVALPSCDAVTGASDIEYTITGLGVQRVAITYEGESGSSQISSATIPWSHAFKAKRDGFLYVSAQISQGTGSITVTIRKNGETIHTGTASGFAAIATASGSNN